ncbi:myosin-1B-like [Periplaneta americana]|uniref:myosin-1B-like n=1 Tax=Periplaneta americana TaxID=6978 RepID=UPI0037E98B5D
MEELQKDENVIGKGSGDLGVVPQGIEEDLKKMKEDPGEEAQGCETALPCTQTENSTATTSETSLEPPPEGADAAMSQETGAVKTGVRIVELIPKVKKEAATADVGDPVTDYEAEAVAASFAEAMKEQSVIENVIGAPISTVVMSETARREPGGDKLRRGISSAIVEVGATAAVAASTQIAGEILDTTLAVVSEVAAAKTRDDELDASTKASKSTGENLKNEEFPEVKLSEEETSVTDTESVTVQRKEVQFSTEGTKKVEQETAQDEKNMKGVAQSSASYDNASIYVENAIAACKKLLDICKKVSDVMPQVSSTCNDISSQYSKLSDKSGELKFKSYEFSAFTRDVIPPTESLVQLFSEETTNMLPVISSTYEFLFTIQKMINMCLYMQNHNTLLELNYNKLYVNTDKEKEDKTPQEIEISFQVVRNILDELVKELESCGSSLDNASQTLENILAESSRLNVESGRDSSQKTATFPRYASRDRTSTSSLSSARSQRFAAARRRFLHISRALRLFFSPK